MDWSRLKNYGLWVSILALIPLILKQFGIYIIPEEYTQIATAILKYISNGRNFKNPTTENKGFLDDNIKNKKEIE